MLPAPLVPWLHDFSIVWQFGKTQFEQYLHEKHLFEGTFAGNSHKTQFEANIWNEKHLFQ
jgi:hypothetical protein